MDIQISDSKPDSDSKPNLLSLLTPPEAGGLIGSTVEIDASSYVPPVKSPGLISNKDVLLNFDDITKDMKAEVPDKYGGLQWSEDWRVIHKDKNPDSGYNRGNKSEPYSAFNAFYKDVTIEAPEKSKDFTFQGYFAAAWDESLNVSVTGFNDGVQEYQNIINVNDQEGTLFEFKTPIDTVEFSSLDGYQFVLDDFSYEFLSEDPGSISGYKWEDLNGNSKWDKDDGEKGLKDWTIYIDENENGQLDGGEPSTLTDSSGYYEFVDLKPATYHIGEFIKEGWKQTYPDLVEPETENSLRSQSSFLNVDDESPEEFSRDKRRPIVEEPDYVEGQVVVQWVDDYDPMEVNAFNLEAGAEILRQIPLSDFAVLDVGPSQSVESFIANNQNHELVESISKNFKLEAIDPPNDQVDISLPTLGVPNDPDFGELWGLHNTGQKGGTVDADIDALEAWDIQTGSDDVVVAVIDTGIDLDHKDLASNIWVNTDETPNNGIDDDNNGYTDDVYGWNFYDKNNDPNDKDTKHGTHVAGTIGAIGNNNIGVVGVNHDVQLMALRFLGPKGGTTAAAIEAIQYATNNGAHLSNNSWGGGGYSGPLYNAIKEADSLFVAAAGNASNNNDTNPSYPASYDLENIIAVASTDDDDNRSSFSNYGAETVDLGAPGSAIYSTVPDDNYDTYNGTSMASPHVAGVAALVLAEDPDLTYAEVKEIILDNVDPNQDLDEITVSGGRLNAEKALKGLKVPGTHTVELKSGESKTDINFGNQEIIPGSISGSKWKDLNDNGQWDKGEEGLKGWTIYIDENKNGELDKGEKYDITDENGDYKLSDIDAGTYHIGEVIKDGWEQTSPGTSPQVEFEADFSDEGNGDLDGFTIDNTGGTNDGLWHLSTRRGNEEGHSAQDSMYYGDETSGNYDKGHTAGRITSEVIDLDGLDDPQLSFNYFLETEGVPSSFDQAKVMVSKDGGNSFQEIASNAVELTDPTTGWTSATFGLDDYSNEKIQIRFDFDTVDSMFNQYEGWFVDDVIVGTAGGPLYHTVDVGNGQDVKDIDFGNKELMPGSISGYKWKDINGNGEWDESEEGLEDWKIYIDENKNGKLDQGEKSYDTDENGYYKFDNLYAGNYVIEEVIQDEWEQTFPSKLEVIFNADFSDDKGEADLDGFIVENKFVPENSLNLQSRLDENGIDILNGGPPNEGLWHLSTRRGNEQGHSAVHSIYYGNEDKGNYNEGHTAGRIISPAIDLSGQKRANLSFNYFLETEGLDPYDKAKVLISTDGGISFNEIASNPNELIDPTTGWTSAEFDLDGYLGKEIQISFEFDTHDRAYNKHEGWYIDDVAVNASEKSKSHEVGLENGKDILNINFGNEPSFEIIEDNGSASFAIDPKDSTYWIINNKTDEKYQLLDEDNGTYTHDSDKNWDGAAVESIKKKKGDGYRFLIDGSNNNDKKAQVWETDSEAVILDKNYKWLSGKKLFKLEKEFAHDLNDDNVIGKPPKKKKSIEGLPTTEDYMLTESNEVLSTMEYDVLPESDPLINIMSGKDFF
jgi:subtilisin family serine protease